MTFLTLTTLLLIKNKTKLGLKDEKHSIENRAMQKYFK
jgi:hypothetical protein